jgi:tetratricopeptide (TPR) repeat protein
MRNQRSLTALVLAVVLWGAASPSAGVRAQANAPQAAASAAPSDKKRFDELRREGFDALYNLDYEGARRRFQELAKAFPDHPAGPQFLAAGLWLKTLNESRRLQASLYNTEGFYKEKDDKADPKTVAEFRELTRQAKALCEARLKADPKDTEALYYLGAVEGLKAAFAGAVERSFMSALRSGSDAVDRHREVLKLDPNFHDAEVTIGMYDYVVGGLPLPVKLMAAIGGIRGSKKKGLATLERVAAEGRWARDDAKSVLIVLYKREKRYMDAFRNASELASKYGRNYIFKMESADALVSQAEVDRARDPEAAKKAEEQAFAIFESLLPRGREAAQGGGSRAPLDLVHYSYGDALFVAGHAERAAKEFLAAAALPNVEPGMATRTRLRAAQALDVAGKREEAVAQYKAVLARQNVFDSHEEAKRGLKEPYKTARKPAEGTANAGSPD